MSSAKNIFSGFLPLIRREAARPEASDLMFIGLGTSFLLFGLGSYRSLSDDFLKNESTYARRYIGKYRKYNLEQAAKEKH